MLKTLKWEPLEQCSCRPAKRSKFIQSVVAIKQQPPPRGGTHIARMYGDMPPSRPPFSDQILAPKTHLFKPCSRDPTWIFFFLIFNFKTNFCQFLAPQTHILAKICSGDPSFKPKKSVPETLFLKARAAHIYHNIFGDYPPPHGAIPTRRNQEKSSPTVQITHP